MKLSTSLIARWKIRRLRKRFDRLIERDPSRWYMHETDYFALKLEILHPKVGHFKKVFVNLWNRQMRKHWLRKEQKLIRFIRFNTPFELNHTRVVVGRDEMGQSRCCDASLRQKVNDFYMRFDNAMTRYKYI